MRPRKRTQGFTLVELLVAMAIFVTIMGGVTVLFTGAVRTVRQGNQIIDVFGMGRGALEVMARDLGTAFTARELGQYHQFYGRPNGFTFVGKLSDGRLGRVTYAIHPDVDSDAFETTMLEPWQNVWERAVTKADEIAVEQRLSDTDRVNLLQATSSLFQSAYPAPGGYFVPLDESLALGTNNPVNLTAVEFSVRVQSHALLRYEEPGITDLDVFPPVYDTNGNRYDWPYLDPVNPAADSAAGLPFESAEGAFYGQLLRAVTRGGRDLRLLAADLTVQVRGDQSSAPYALNPAAIDDLIDAQRRDLWVRLIAGDPSLPVRFWGDPGNPFDPVGTTRNPLDHVIAERILVTADLFTPDGREPIFVPGTQIFLDALLVPGTFLYFDETERDTRWYNALINVDRSTGGLYDAALRQADVAAVEAFDFALVRAYGERRDAEARLGSPLAPRIPALVSPGFWLMEARPAPGAPDFRRWFTQTIDVPSATGRDISPRVVARQRQG
jgi:prepilin-type N-terminal cleavage/methylation domain-containing protein